MVVVSMGFVIEVPYEAGRSAVAAAVHPAARSLAGVVFVAVEWMASRRHWSWPPLTAWGLALGVYGAAVLPHPLVTRVWWIGRPGLLLLCAAFCVVVAVAVTPRARDLHRSLSAAPR
jgi:peptidoglycan/LPS O-acetylase OafA/YrhL